MAFLAQSGTMENFECIAFQFASTDTRAKMTNSLRQRVPDKSFSSPLKLKEEVRSRKGSHKPQEYKFHKNRPDLQTVERRKENTKILDSCSEDRLIRQEHKGETVKKCDQKNIEQSNGSNQSNSWRSQLTDLQAHLALLDNGVDVEAIDVNGQSALHIAASYSSDKEFIELLLKSGANPNSVNNTLASPLHTACHFGNLTAVKVLLKGGSSRSADIRLLDIEEKNCMHWATIGGNLEIVELLIDNKLPLDKVDLRGETVLSYAAYYGHIDIARKFITSGADPNSTNVENITPLHWACFQGQPLIVRDLLDAGANVNALERSNLHTPLDYALNEFKLSGPISHSINANLAKKRKECIQYLLQDDALSSLDIQTTAAIKIQNMWRSYHAQKMYKVIKKMKFAATTIQAKYRAHLGMRNYEEMKKRHAASLILGKFTRGWLGKRQIQAQKLERKLYELHNKSAKIIQASFRAREKRKNFKKMLLFWRNKRKEEELEAKREKYRAQQNAVVAQRKAKVAQRQAEAAKMRRIGRDRDKLENSQAERDRLVLERHKRQKLLEKRARERENMTNEEKKKVLREQFEVEKELRKRRYMAAQRQKAALKRELAAMQDIVEQRKERMKQWALRLDEEHMEKIKAIRRESKTQKMFKPEEIRRKRSHKIIKKYYVPSFFPTSILSASERVRKPWKQAISLGEAGRGIPASASKLPSPCPRCENLVGPDIKDFSTDLYSGRRSLFVFPSSSKALFPLPTCTKFFGLDMSFFGASSRRAALPLAK
eukprot:UC4_evm2s945